MTCALCGAEARRAELAEASWLAPELLDNLERAHPGWKRQNGACTSCVEETLLSTLIERSSTSLPRVAPGEWMLDSEAAYGILPTPLKMHADPRVTGRGVTMAFVDSGFHPHADLTQPKNRILAWADASTEPVRCRFFDESRTPRWPGSGGTHGSKWHGLMTSAVAAGNGKLSHGLYRGLASGAALILVQVRRPDGHIGDAEIARALSWLRREGPDLGLRVVNLSVGGDPIPAGRPDIVSSEVTALVDSGVTVVAAAGNDGIRRLVAPASSPAALTIGGLDDRNTFDHDEAELWHSNFGEVADGRGKPELVAPSIWVVAPLLPGTDKAKEAAALFARRHRNDPVVEARIAAQKYVSPHYHHVDGTSVAAPLVASVVACMLEANPALTPALIRRVLTSTARPVPGAPRERQGAGAVDAGEAVAMAWRGSRTGQSGAEMSPYITPETITFVLHQTEARRVSVYGSWDGWRPPGIPARLIGPGLWRAELPRPPAGRHTYKFLLDQTRWLADPDNPNKEPDGTGGMNSIVMVER